MRATVKQRLPSVAAILLAGLLAVEIEAIDRPAVRLILDAAVQATQSVPLSVQVAFDNGGQSITALVFSLDLDPARLTFDPADADLDGLPDAITLPAGRPSITVIDYDPADSDGEIDILLADLSGVPLPQGVILSFEMTPSQNGIVASWLDFSDDPPVSFGNDLGQDVAGIPEVIGAEIFANGFESGDTSAWFSGPGRS